MAVAMDFVHMEQEVVGPSRPKVGRKSLVALAAGATAGAVVVACTGLAGSVQDENTDGRALAQRAVQVEECIPASKAGKITGAAYEPLGVGFFEVPPNECRSACLTNPDCGVYTYRAHPQNKDDYLCALFNRNVTLSDVSPTEEYVTETRACEYENQDADTDDNSGTSSWLDEVPDKISAIWDSFGFEKCEKDGHIVGNFLLERPLLGGNSKVELEENRQKCRQMCLDHPECKSVSIRPMKRCTLYGFEPQAADISNNTEQHEYHGSSKTESASCFKENKRLLPKGVTKVLSHIVPVVANGVLNAVFSPKGCQVQGRVYRVVEVDGQEVTYNDHLVKEPVTLSECRDMCTNDVDCHSLSYIQAEEKCHLNRVTLENATIRNDDADAKDFISEPKPKDCEATRKVVDATRAVMRK